VKDDSRYCEQANGCKLSTVLKPQAASGSIRHVDQIRREVLAPCSDQKKNLQERVAA